MWPKTKMSHTTRRSKQVTVIVFPYKLYNVLDGEDPTGSTFPHQSKVWPCASPLGIHSAQGRW